MQHSIHKVLALGAVACICLETPPLATASTTEQHLESYENPSFKHDYAELTVVLENSLTSKSDLIPIARLQRTALRAQEKRLDAIIAEAGRVSHGDFNEFSRQQRTAFTVNTANAWILKFVIHQNEIRPPSDLEAAPITIFGETVSLARLRRMIATSLGARPMASLALLCLSAYCPELSSSALHPERTDAQLEKLVGAFLSDRSKNSFDEKRGVFSVSPAILLNRKALESEYGSLGGFLAKYLVRDRVLTWKAKSGSYRIETAKTTNGGLIEP